MVLRPNGAVASLAALSKLIPLATRAIGGDDRYVSRHPLNASNQPCKMTR